jgi:N-acetylmuramoyl-L-alanine amidase
VSSEEIKGTFVQILDNMVNKGMWMTLISQLLVACALLGAEPSYDALFSLQPLRGQTICVDAGHGGQDLDCTCFRPSCYTGGTFGVYTRQSEGDVNLDVSIYLKQYLKSLGATVVMTRENRCRITPGTDAKTELAIRPFIAKQAKSDLFISIHHNDAPNQCINYSMVFYNDDVTTRSKRLSHWILNEVAKGTGVTSNGVSRANFAVLRQAQMPAVLVEASFLSNPQQDYLLNCWTYRKQEAWCIAKGICLYTISEKWRQAFPGTQDWSKTTDSKSKPKMKSKSKRRKRHRH